MPHAFAPVEPRPRKISARAGIGPRHGFSLVELSIVLVILGLLTGGILAGQSLIRAAELRAVATETERYATAIHAFRDKYLAMPGDMNNATSFWGKDAAACNGQTGAAATPGTCNGNGDGVVSVGSAPSVTAETFQSWKQLALGGLIAGSYSGISGSASAHDVMPVGTNVPASRLGQAGYTFFTSTVTAGDTNHYSMIYGHHLIFGSGTTLYHTLGPALKPEEVWNIDTKLDDGKPGLGRIIAVYWTTCTTSTSMTDFTGEYRLNVNSLSCGFRYKNIV